MQSQPRTSQTQPQQSHTKPFDGIASKTSPQASIVVTPPATNISVRGRPIVSLITNADTGRRSRSGRPEGFAHWHQTVALELTQIHSAISSVGEVPRGTARLLVDPIGDDSEERLRKQEFHRRRQTDVITAQSSPALL
jgi:hypothetical protein